MHSFGVSGAVVTSADASAAPAAVTDAPESGKKLVITGVTISSAAAITVDLEEETSGTILANFYMAANSTVLWKPAGKTKLAVADKKLMVQTSGAGAVSVTAHYYSEL